MWAWPWYADIGNLWNKQQEMETRMTSIEGRLEAVLAQVTKASGEITSLVEDLRGQIAAGTVDPATVDALEAVAQGLDDVVPDAPPPEA